MHIPKIKVIIQNEIVTNKKGSAFFMENKNTNEFDKKHHEDFEERVNGTLEEKYEVGEDSTKYGEFISSYFAWISLPNQKERAEELHHMTKGKNNKIKEKTKKSEKKEEKDI